MFFLIYNLLSLFLLVPVCVYHFYRSFSRGRNASFGERFGFLPAHELKKLGSRPVIWLHAVSVGETIAARPLLKGLRSRFPGHAIVLSSTTETGRGVAEGYAEKDLCIYFPFDFLPAVKRSLDLVRPALIIIMETEIWPNFTRQAALRGIPVILANGRISDRSFPRYLRFSWFFRHALEHFSRLCMQTDSDRERIVAIGAPAERSETTGNLKYDIPCRQLPDDERASLKQRYGIPQDAFILVAGSTHPGEEIPVLTAFADLLSHNCKAFLVLVPRHPERGGEVDALVKQAGLKSRRRSVDASALNMQDAGEVFLVDTVGELMAMYSLADLVFVGGSLVPTGGHNLLEPASVGVASIFGPHTSNFREISALVLKYGAGVMVENPEALNETCREMAACPELRNVLGQNGLKLMRDSGGATGRHLDAIAGCLAEYTKKEA